MNFTLKQLRYLVTVAEHNNVTAAAQALYVSQPAISSAIAQLEAMFEADLIIRHQSKGVSLTPAGRNLVAAARNLLAHADELASESKAFSRSLSGTLELGCFVTIAPFHVPRLIKGFGERHPDIHVRIREGAMDSLQESLRAGLCEIALLYDLELEDTFTSQLMAEIPPYVLLAKEHPLARADAIYLKELAQEPMILINLPHSRDYFQSLFLRLDFEPNIIHRTMSFELVRGLVANGAGYSILNLRPVPDITYDGAQLVCLPIKDEVKPLRIILAQIRGVRLTRRAMAFVDYCRDYFSNQSSQ